MWAMMTGRQSDARLYQKREKALATPSTRQSSHPWSATRTTLPYRLWLSSTTLFSECHHGKYRTIANTARTKYANLSNDTYQNEATQCEILSAIDKLACSGSSCLQSSETSSRSWKGLNCTLCDVESNSDREANVYWNGKDDSEDWKDVLAAMLMITKEPKFQASAKARVHMAVAIGRVFNHISDVDYLNLEICELGQWLLGSMSRSLRELKIAST